MTSKPDQQAIALLRENRLRATGGRVAVLATLLEAGRPLTRQQIADRLGGQAPDKATIYRALQRLVDSDLVHRAFVQQRQWYFEPAHRCGATQCHPHFTCVQCRRTDCLHDVAAALVTLPDGMTLLRQQIRIEGICASCCDN